MRCRKVCDVSLLMDDFVNNGINHLLLPVAKGWLAGVVFVLQARLFPVGL